MSTLRRPGFFLWLLLAAMLANRALLPSGTMPERDQRGGISVTLCNSDGVWLIPMRADHSAPDEDRQQRDHAPCAFAGMVGGILPSETAQPTAPGTGALVYGYTVATLTIPVPRRSMPPARAPPLPA